VPVEGAPFRGTATAPVTIVEFQDFHCPFCQRVQPTLTELLARYAGKLKLVYRDFPIDSLHPQSRKAHEAARCANDQGKFWAYHDLVFANPPNASPEQLKGYAQSAGLDVPAFEQCLRSEKFQAAVQHDVEAGVHLGVDATPTFFINGRLLSGAQPLEGFVKVIDDELARAH
jgi:protein-disulfide isomerase